MQVCGNIDSDSGVYRTITPAEDSDTFDQRFALFEQSHDSWLLSFTSALQREARQAIDERNSGGNHDKFDKLCAIYSATLKELQDGLMAQLGLKPNYAQNLQKMDSSPAEYNGVLLFTKAPPLVPASNDTFPRSHMRTSTPSSASQEASLVP